MSTWYSELTSSQDVLRKMYVHCDHKHIISYHIICKIYSAPITLYKTTGALPSSYIKLSWFKWMFIDFHTSVLKASQGWRGPSPKYLTYRGSIYNFTDGKVIIFNTKLSKTLQLLGALPQTPLYTAYTFFRQIHTAYVLSFCLINE